jgi:DUF1680 family protein
MKKDICKQLSYCLLLSTLTMISPPSFAQLSSLPRESKFKIGDDMNWANLSFNDAGWETKELGKSWAAADTKGDVYAWYRIKFIIPSAMKALVEKEKGIKINLGKIDDVDQTFFNGKLIGQTGSFPPAYQTKWDTERTYIIPANEVQWDNENVVAVRVFSPDYGGVGMYQGAYNFGPVQWSDFMIVKQSITATANKGFTTTVSFVNGREQFFDGTITYRVTDKNGRNLFSETKPVQVQPVKGAAAEIQFSNYQPAGELFFKVSYTVKENNSTVSLSGEKMYLADRELKIPVLDEPMPVVQNKVKDVFTSIAFQDQQQQGYLGRRMNQNLAERLLKIDEEGTLDGYLERPGHHPWAGEHIGKYLETACNVWKNTANTTLKAQMDRMMYLLINAQLPDGYLGTYVPVEYWTSWDVWSHKYNLYGLLAYYTTTGYPPALDACKKMGDLLCNTFGNKPGQRDIIKAGEHIGMAATSVLDPMVELYRYTGEKKYLDFCYYILEAWEQNNGPKIISSLLATGKVNKVANGKAYEMLSNLVGLAKLYRLTGDEKLLQPVLIAWNDIVSKRLYITGSASTHEIFKEDEYLPGTTTDNIGEGCVTTTWIQLNHNLLSCTGSMKYEEQIERAVYNHLLGAENPGTGCVSYYTPLMDKKPYTCNITCCQSSVPRGISMIPYFTFGNSRNVPMVMMYEPAMYKETIITADNKTINLSLYVKSDFPEKGNAEITVNIPAAAAFAIGLRVPSWSRSFIVRVGKDVYQIRKPGQDLNIHRNWKPGDKIFITFQMPVQLLTGGKTYPGQVALQRGPQVLAVDDTLNTRLLTAYKLIPQEKWGVYKMELGTALNSLPGQWVGKQAYTLAITESKNKKVQQLILVPFADASQTGGALKVWLPLTIKR